MFTKWKQISADVYKHPIIERQSIDIIKPCFAINSYDYIINKDCLVVYCYFIHFIYMIKMLVMLSIIVIMSLSR